MIADMQHVEAWTDGSCHPIPGPGGWGVVLRWPAKGQELELWGGEHRTTNNVMELTAAIQALSRLKRPSIVRVYTDSKYVQRGFDSHIHIWKQNGWLNYHGEPVKNADLWRELDQAAKAHRTIFHWIKGHAGTMMNERADRLARRGRHELRPYGT